MSGEGSRILALPPTSFPAALGLVPQMVATPPRVFHLDPRRGCSARVQIESYSDFHGVL